MQNKAVPRLEYLDGLRGLAALYVVLFHAGVGFTSADLPFWARALRHVLSFGHDAVAVFIVLSGYCLMIPAARRDGEVSGGIVSYFRRRARRILPPYYGALLLSLIFVLLLPAGAAKSGTIWDDTYPAIALAPIATHLALVHNWFPAYVHTVNGPLWSVATEWQIYFFFPLALLPVWRRAGRLGALALGFALGSLPIWFAPKIAAVVNPWYLGLFALGMCAAGINFSSRPADVALRASNAWRAFVWLGFVVLALGFSAFSKLWFENIVLSDVVMGTVTALLLIHYTRHATAEDRRERPFGLRVLESTPLVALGRFSYSLYLTHLPLVAAWYFALRGLTSSQSSLMIALLACSVPSSIVLAYGFFSLVERRFLLPHAAPRVESTARTEQAH
ncbi:MAG TPA: acyltransferase [Polyangiaceae bacterium]|jgi:peptidoglycan/LPS O-acetylase OafA/YrhL